MYRYVSGGRSWNIFVTVMHLLYNPTCQNKNNIDEDAFFFFFVPLRLLLAEKRDKDFVLKKIKMNLNNKDFSDDLSRLKTHTRGHTE